MGVARLLHVISFRTMKFRSVVKEHWPQGAWFARWSKSEQTVHVLHGSGVIVRADRLFEGVWDGDFAEGRFVEATVFTGSGIRLQADSVELIPSLDFQNACVFVNPDSSDDEQCASNSLLCWLTQTGNALDPTWGDYYIDLVRVFSVGIVDELPTLRLKDGARVGVVALAGWSISAQGGERMPSAEVDWFEPNFASYRAFIKGVMTRIQENATSPDRPKPLGVKTTLSTGYDSVAVSVLARELGVTEAITILGREDARELGKRLGLELRARHRSRSLLLPNRVVHECFAMPIGQNRPLAIFERELTDSVLFSGQGGDITWGMKRWFEDERLRAPKFHAMVLISQLEHRLRVGYSLVAVGVIGNRRADRVMAITTSPEMVDFQEGERGRPIPRRIGVEAGIPAELFGQTKTAGAIAAPEVFSGLWNRSFKKFLRSVPDPTATAYRREDYPNFYASPYRWTMHWAHEQMKDRYRD